MTINDNILSQELTIPEKWEELTLIQFLRFIDWVKSEDRDELEAFSILSGLDRELIEKVPFQQVQKINSLLPKIEDFPDLDSLPLPNEIEIDDKKVRVPKNPETVAFGAWENVKATAKRESSLSGLMPYVLAHFLQENYSNSKYNEDLADSLISKVSNGPALQLYVVGAFFLTNIGHRFQGGLTALIINLTQWKKAQALTN